MDQHIGVGIADDVFAELDWQRTWHKGYDEMMDSKPGHHDALTAKYGFGLFPLPTYHPKSQGDWRITTHMPSLANGYLSTTAIEAHAVLKRGHKVWMSTGLLEQESHSWHVHCAKGIVVTAGLGMGMYAYAAAMKQCVDLVIVADISPDIIELMKKATNFDYWPCRDKVKIIEADVLSPGFAAKIADHTGGEPIDYLYADIWPNFPAEEAPAQTAKMTHALRPRAAGWWGQELSFGQHCRRTECPANEDSLRAYFTELDISMPSFTSGYIDFCRDAMVANGMGTTKPIWKRLGNLFRWR